tara:strand:+ start:814 stop:1332 length:519 start_codon:yes stop_codon:yes gene_type:complete
MKNNIIYGLRDPRNDTYMYVGKTTVGRSRPLKHLRQSSHNELVNTWVEELNNKGLSPFIDVIEEDLELDTLHEREQYWICEYRKVNPDIFNGSTRTILNGDKITNLTKEDIQGFINVISDTKSLVNYIKINTGLNLTEVSVKSNISRASIHRLKNNKSNISLDTILKLITLL